MGNQIVHMMIGIPGSGKSTIAKKLQEKYGPDCALICPDDGLLKDGKYVFTPSNSAKTWAQCYSRFHDELYKGTSHIIWDATFVHPRARKEVIRICDFNRIPLIAHVVATPFEVAEERNAARSEDRRVPKDAMGRMKERYKEPELEEGFKAIVTHMADGKTKGLFGPDILDIFKGVHEE